MNEITTSKRFVRMYSFEVANRLSPDNPAHPLGQVLRRHAGDPSTADYPWRKFFEPYPAASGDDDPITTVISVEAEKLQQRWFDFQGSLRPEDRLDLNMSEPTMESVLDTVSKMESAWQATRKTSFRGGVNSRFHKFCGTLDSHSNLLKVMPEGSHYVSLFSGTLNAVIAASVNHEHIAGGLADALCSISENVTYIETELEIFQTKAVRERVADFYAHVFVFLSSFMEWMMKKRRSRLMDSFNDKVSGTFDSDINMLNEKSASIRHLAEQSSRAEVRATRLTAEGTRLSIEGLAEDVRDIRVGLQGMARQQAEMEYAAKRWAALQQRSDEEKRHWLEDPSGFEQHLLAAMKNCLMDEALAFVRETPMKAILGASQMRGGGGQGNLLPATTGWTAEEVAINSVHLEDFFYRDRVRIPIDIDGPINVPGDLYPHLAGWIRGTSGSRIFWVDGPALEAEDYDNPITMLATWLTHLAAKSRIPIISYLGELRRGDRIREGNSWTTQSLIAVVLGLSRQMVELLLPRFEAEIDLSESRFQQLDGTIKYWSEAMALFGDLGKLVPPGLMCVVDGLHWVDDGTTDSCLTEFIAVLRRSGFKVLLTTSGRAPTLLDILYDSEVLHLESFYSTVEISGIDETFNS